MKVQAIIPAAGSGLRLKTKRPKPLVLLKSKPLFIYALRAIGDSPSVESIIVAVAPQRVKIFEELIKKFKLKKIKRVVAGGKTRAESVQNGLKALDRDTDVVIVHDGARPFVTSTLIKQAINLMRTEKAVVVAVPVKSTIKKVDPKNLYVQETLVRDTLWDIQTPQVFKRDVLEEAHRKMLCCEPTDDAVLVEKMGVKVKILKGDYRNIKITTPEDFELAKILQK